MKIHKFKEHSLYNEMTYNFVNSFELMINESDKTDYKFFQNKIMDDLKLNTKLILTFGTGINTFYPIVDSLMKNMNIDSIEVTPDKVVMLTICAFTVIYLEERKFKSAKEEEILTKDSKSMLEELRMMGIGDGIVKGLVKVFKSIVNIFILIGKHVSAVVSGFIDMFAYTAIMIPIMNAILFTINKYDLNISTFVENFKGLAIGLVTIIAKHGISYLINKLNLDRKSKKEITDEIDTSLIQKVSNYDTTDNTDGEPINDSV